MSKAIIKSLDLSRRWDDPYLTADFSICLDDTNLKSFHYLGSGDEIELASEILYMTSNSHKPVTKCQYCGQWGVRYSECVKCGGSIE